MLRHPLPVAAALLLAAATPAAADGYASSKAFELRVAGYGELGTAFYDHGANQNRPGGAQRDRRLELDATRFVTKLEGLMTDIGLEFEAEVEFEHGGTGAEMEVENEEFGEVEQEVGKGGEVLLEEFYVKKSFGPLDLQFGRFYIGVGTLSYYYRPTDYLAGGRAEAEVTVIPAQWDEMGFGATYHSQFVRVTGQIVNGLDSSGFGSPQWVTLGHQGRFELIRASDLAAVARVDVTPISRVEAGVSFYAGGTSRNRPKADLVPSCTNGDPEEVAPCGYVSAPLIIVDAHAHAEVGPVRANALVLWGHLDNADVISERNARLPNGLGAPRTPVGSQALAAWAEVGVDLAPWIQLGRDHALEPFLRLDHYDTMFATPSGVFDNPRFERTLVTGGVSYTLRKALVAKLDVSHRWFGSSALRAENTARFALGFAY